MMREPLITPPIAPNKDNGYDGRFEQALDDEVMFLTEIKMSK